MLVVIPLSEVPLCEILIAPLTIMFGFAPPPETPVSDEPSPANAVAVIVPDELMEPTSVPLLWNLMSLPVPSALMVRSLLDDATVLMLGLKYGVNNHNRTVENFSESPIVINCGVEL